MRHFLSVTLCIAMVLSLLVGCGSASDATTITSEIETEKSVVEVETPVEIERIDDSEKETIDSIVDDTEESAEEEIEPIIYDLPLTDTETQFSLYTTSAPPFMTPFIGTDGSYNTADSNQYFLEQTGVKIDYIEIDMFSYTQNFNLMIASGDYPDLLSGMASYNGGMTKAYDDDIIIDLTDYVKNEMPAYHQALDAADVWKEVTTDEGMILAVYSLSNEDVVNRGPMIRQDWLDETGMAAPKTYDELTEVGKAIQSQQGISYVFFISALVNPGVTLSAGYDLPGFDIQTSGSGFYQENGEVKSCLVSDGLKEYLKYLNSWYQAGLVSKDFFSRISSDVKDAFRGGECAVCWDNADSITEHNQDAEFASKGAVAAGLPIAVQEEGQTLHFSVGMNNLVGDGLSITTKCQDPELLINTLDWCFTEPGIMLCNYGIEGISYDLDAEGNWSWSKNVTENPDTTFRMALVTYTMTGLPSVWNEERYWSEIYDEAAYAAADLWMSADNDKSFDLPSSMFFDSDEAAIYSVKVTDVETYANEYILSAVLGEVDVDATWDAYVEAIWGLGLQECLDAEQGAYDRYLTRG